MTTLWPGLPYPLGATWDGVGANFAVFSDAAEQVWLCLFGPDGHEEQLELTEQVGSVWHGYVPSISPGTHYGFRTATAKTVPGDLTNPHKLLLDPYAKAIDGRVQWDDAVDSPDARERDSAPFVPRSVVVNPYFDWGNDHHPRTEWHETVLYEAHVKGLTMSHPDVPEEQRGTYLGVASAPIVDHLKALGVTAIELMPVHQFIHDRRLIEAGLSNYWGYNSIGFFAPHNGYALSGGPAAAVHQFKLMVKALHAAGIEVILDVVYNHTAEAGRGGPVLSFKGLDNGAYYRLDPENPDNYIDYTGTGNSLNMRHPHVLQLIMDSLRYWIEEMHVDGFRFDLAATLARELHDVDRLSAFFDLIQQDPIVNKVKLIAEPWDVGEGGYQVGNFPPLWSEWNGRYRDCVRDVWRNSTTPLGEFAARLGGSSDLYEHDRRRPHASINFITAHDGFTLTDLVSYEHKNNLANGEDNRDGTDDNRSWNCGVEGPTSDPEVLELRARQRRNLILTLLVSQGVPMLLAGDELGRTQLGNNNAYAQDNEISWIDWATADSSMLDFTRSVLHLRRDNPALSRRRFLTGRPVNGSQMPDIAWFRPDGHQMNDDDWGNGSGRVGFWLNGELEETGKHGEHISGRTLLVIFNSSSEAVEWILPEAEWGEDWRIAVDTADPCSVAAVGRLTACSTVSMVGHSCLVLEQL
ncbi:MAG: glycogen debranching protein GlgX [Microthrixaceae bacterium]|nr:glycogen debranching protein GlgX [Microthrixaceae bacterium]